MFRRAIIAVLTVAVVLTAILHVSTYRPSPCAQATSLNVYWVASPFPRVGLSNTTTSKCTDPCGWTLEFALDKKRTLYIDGSRGQLTVAVWQYTLPSAVTPDWTRRLGFVTVEKHTWGWPAGSWVSRVDASLNKLGLSESKRDAYWSVSVDLWVPFLLFAAYPTIAFIRGPVRRWHRRRNGLCIECGYNLTGNVSGVCPECGRELEIRCADENNQERMS